MHKSKLFFKAVGENIRYYREKRGFTQEKLAVRAHMTDGYISMLENGLKNATLETLLRIGDALDVDPNLFLVLPKQKKGK
jgi:transcriptional regulator with XRE-family HTH domain